MRPSEILLFALLAGGVYLFNLVMQWLARRAKRQQPTLEPQQGEIQQPAPAPLPAGLDIQWGRPAPGERSNKPALEELPRRPPLASEAGRTVPAPPPGHRPARGRLFRTRRELRQAIVTMTVLGPCRAQHPYDATNRE